MLIDVHGHIGRIVPDRREFVDVTNLLEKMDKWGIDMTFVLPLSEHPEGAYLECNTEDVILKCSRFPDRLKAFCLIDPRFGNDPEMDFRPYLEEYKKRGCIGLGELLPKMNFDDDLCINLYNQCALYEMPVLFDMQDRDNGYGLRDDYGLVRLERALKLCPDTIFIGHGPTFWAEISRDVPHDERSGYPKGKIEEEGAVSRLMRKYSNLWADISAGSGHNGLTRDFDFGIKFLKEFSDRIMFGTDSCVRSDVLGIYPNVAYIRELEERKLLDGEAIENIKWKNATRLFKLKI